MDKQSVPALVFAGKLILDDNSNVYGANSASSSFFSGDYPIVDIAGELMVGQNNTWQIRTSALSISGTVRPNTNNASIDFQGVPSSLVLSSTTFAVSAGQTLKVSINGDIYGDMSPVGMDGPEACITGSGTLEGSFNLSNGGQLAPGASPGLLTIAGNLDMGDNARYEWEIDDPNGEAGIDWDLVFVEGELSFGLEMTDSLATSLPWTIAIHDAGERLPANSMWQIASAGSIANFEPSVVQFDLSGLSSANSHWNPNNFSVVQQGNGLFLTISVPEPNSLVLLLSLAGLLPLAFRRRVASQI